MPFDLNKLVQPECGGANPLVATARQIAMRPSTSTYASTPRPNRVSSRQRDTTNFANEFLGQKIQQLQLSNQQQQHQQSMILQSMTATGTAPLLYHPASTSSSTVTSASMAPAGVVSAMSAYQTSQQHLGGNFSQRPSQAQMSSMFETQLETKYRNDILSSSIKSHEQQQQQHQHQHQPVTTGLTNEETHKQEETTNDDISKTETTKERVDDVEFWQTLSQHYVGPPTFVAPSETEYIFDERNPLKDLYEDPFAEGLKKLEMGDIPSAALLFEAAVLKDPENATAWRFLGTTQAQNEKDISAIRALKNCLKFDANDQEARLAISVSLANENFKNEACHYLLEWLINHDKYKSIRASFEEFNKLDRELSDDPYTMKVLDERHYNYVREKFVEAARMSPNHPDHEVQSSLGVLFNMQGEYDKAVDCFKAALSVRSDDSLLWNRLGATLANGNKSDEAVIAYRKALEISPGFLRSRYNLAISLIHLNTYDEAAKQLVQILNMQAAGKGSKNAQIRTRSITSTAIWNTLRTVATLLNKPELYSIIDGRDLARCNEELLQKNRLPQSTSAAATTSN